MGWDDFSEDSDEAAVVRATQLRRGHAAELWERHRKIWTFERSVPSDDPDRSAAAKCGRDDG